MTVKLSGQETALAPASTGILRCIGTVLALIVGCSSPSADPAPEKSAASRSESAVKTIDFETPSSWVKTESSPSGARRAVYKVPPSANDKEDAEVLVLFFGTGANGDRDKNWDPWFKQFDGDAKAGAKRDSFEVNGMLVETFEHMGTYKLNMGPRVPGRTSAPMQLVKQGFRMIGAVVHTNDRGNWFFRIVGPNDTVLSARDGFIATLKSVK